MSNPSSIPSTPYPSSLPDAGIAATDWALDIMFGSRKAEAWVTPVIDTAIPSQWTGDRYAAIGSELQAKSHAGHYVCIALLRKGTARRVDENVEVVAGLVFDDVGDLSDPNTKMDITWFQLQPEPSFVVETSEKNFQFFYVFDNPVSPTYYRKLIDALKQCPETVGGIRDGTTASRYVRLPSGQNPKAGRGGFRTRLVEAAGVKYEIGALTKAFGLSEAAGAAASPAAEAGLEVLHLPEPEAIQLLTEAMALIRNNDIGREDWIGLVFAIWNASGESETSEEIAFQWTASREDGVVDPIKDMRDVWEHRRGTKAGLTTIIRWLDLQGTLAAGAMVRRIKLIQAQGVFTVIADDGTEKEDKPAAAVRRLRVSEILAQPGFKHAKSKTILNGVDQGEVTLVGGPSGAMKSLWVQQAAVAIIAEKAEVIGEGKIDYCGSVVFYANEDQPEQVMKRIDGIMRFHKLGWPLRHELHLWTGKLLSRKGIGQIVANRIEVAALKELARSEKIAVVVVDTLAAALVSEETNLEFQLTMNLLKELAGNLQVAIVVVHHFRKGQPGKNDEPTLESVRGGSTLTASARNVLFVEPPSPKETSMFKLDEEAHKYMKLNPVKQSNQERGNKRWFKREVTEIETIDERDGALGEEGAPVLTPVKPLAQAMSIELDAVHKSLFDAQAAGVVIRRGGAKGKRHDDHAGVIVEKAFGCSRKDAESLVKQIIDSEAGIVRTEWIRNNPVIVMEIILPGPIISTDVDDEEDT